MAWVCASTCPVDPSWDTYDIKWIHEIRTSNHGSMVPFRLSRGQSFSRLLVLWISLVWIFTGRSFRVKSFFFSMVTIYRCMSVQSLWLKRSIHLTLKNLSHPNESTQKHQKNPSKGFFTFSFPKIHLFSFPGGFQGPFFLSIQPIHGFPATPFVGRWRQPRRRAPVPPPRGARRKVRRRRRGPWPALPGADGELRQRPGHDLGGLPREPTIAAGGREGTPLWGRKKSEILEVFFKASIGIYGIGI